MKKSLVVGLLASVLGFAAQADGFYVGGELQQTKSYGNEFCGDDATTCELKPTGYRLNAGYGFNDYLAIEAGYMNSGDFESGYADSGYESEGSVTSEALDLSLVGRLPIGDMFSIFGRVGVAQVMNDVSVSDTLFGSYSYDNDVTTYVYGIGAQFGWFVAGYDIISNNELEIEGITVAEEDIKRVYAGVKFGF